MVWFNETDLEEFEIIELKKQPKGNGWILIGIQCDAFAWNSHPDIKHLIPAMAQWIDSAQGKAIKCVKDKTDPKKFQIVPMLLKGKPIEQKWMFTGNGYKVSIDGEAQELNPFL